ncbi:MAG: SDR family NAD(P)-dependent oxidoreductase [Rhodospirillales bacterium]
MTDLDGKVAIVTGASRGIGRGVAIGLASAGASVAITARTATPADAPELASNDARKVPGTLSETADAVSAAGGTALMMSADLGDRSAIESLVEETVRQLGRVDIVVNCAMGFPQDYEGMAFWKSPVEDWDVQNSVGARSHFLLAYYATPHLIRQGRGLIANVSTAGAISEYYNLGFRVAHAANTRMAKAMACDLKDHGVAAIALWPRWVLTERVQLAARNDHPGFHVDPAELGDADMPEMIGAAIACLYTDPGLSGKSGHVQLIAELIDEYGLLKDDGSKPKIDAFTRELRQRLDRIEAQLDWP